MIEPIGFVVANVRFPLYEGDKMEGPWDWFVYREPGITDDGNIGTCNRECQTVDSEIVMLPKLHNA